MSKAFLCCADRVLVSLAVTPRLSYSKKYSQLWLTVDVEHARACCHPSPFKGPSFAAAAAWPPVPPLVRLGTTSNSRPAWLCWQPKVSLFLIGHMCVTQVSITPRDGGRNPLPKLHTTHPTPPPGFLCTPSNTALPLLCTTQARATMLWLTAAYCWLSTTVVNSNTGTVGLGCIPTIQVMTTCAPAGARSVRNVTL